MNKNLLWKMGIIGFVIFFAFLWVWPPQDKLKAGLDIAGGTSMIWTGQVINADVAGIPLESCTGACSRSIVRIADPGHPHAAGGAGSATGSCLTIEARCISTAASSKSSASRSIIVIASRGQSPRHAPNPSQ